MEVHVLGFLLGNDFSFINCKFAFIRVIINMCYQLVLHFGRVKFKLRRSKS